MELSRCKLKKFLIIFQKKKILIFREMELSSPKLKTLTFFPKNSCLYFRRELEKPGKQNVYLALKFQNSIFFIRIFSFRRNLEVVSNKLRSLFYCNNIFKFF